MIKCLGTYISTLSQEDQLNNRKNVEVIFIRSYFKTFPAQSPGSSTIRFRASQRSRTLSGSGSKWATTVIPPMAGLRGLTTSIQRRDWDWEGVFEIASIKE